MTEEILHFIWKFQKFDQSSLKTTKNKSLNFLDVGHWNKDAGADFSLAKLKIDDIEWVGDIEIHLKSSDWEKHAHQKDKRYNQVILHVVWEDDKVIFRPDKSPIPTLELKNRVSGDLLRRCQDLLANQSVIPCEARFEQVRSISKLGMLDKALTQRLEKKAQKLRLLWLKNNQNWEETAYQLLAQSFGFKINQEVFLDLSQRLPLKYLLKHRDQPVQIEALFFGHAGLLKEVQEIDEYCQKLQKEYQFLAQKYQLQDSQLSPTVWKFARTRPANFPTIRMAQLSALILKNANLFSAFLSKDLEGLKKLFQVEVSPYWKTHYLLGKKSEKKHKAALGASSIENILINTVVPILVLYSQEKNQPKYLEKATSFLEYLAAENNKILQTWASLGMKVKTAFDSQALIELYNHFCLEKRCLQCQIGNEILSGDD